MKDSVKLAATKFQAWKRDNTDEGYQYDEIQEFTSSLSRGELLEVFEWLEENVFSRATCPKCSDRGIVQDEQGRNSTCECHYE